MICVSHKKFDEVYLFNMEDISRIKRLSFCMASESDSNIVVTERLKTLYIPLSQTPEELLSGMKKMTRYEVRRGFTKDCVEFIHKTEITEDDIEESLIMNKEVYKKKGINFDIDFYRNLYRIMNAQKCLTITKAKRSSDIFAIHTYFNDKRRVRLIASSSKRFGQDPVLVGRINKALHYSDLLYFRERNLAIYDFGGISDATMEYHTVAQFKRGFGGYEVDQFSGWFPTSLLERIQIAGFLAKTRLRKQLHLLRKCCREYSVSCGRLFHRGQ